MPERPPVIRHPLPEVQWPTAEEARRSLWFQSIRINQLTLRNRTWVPAMVPWRATEDGQMTRDVLDWYARFARGRPGVIVVEATGIRDIASGPLLRIGHDRFETGLAKLVETVRGHSCGETHLFIQIIDFLSIRRRPTREKYFRQHLTITDRHRSVLAGRNPALHGIDDTALREALLATGEEELREILTEREHRDYFMGYREDVNDRHLERIKNLPSVLPDLFADAAERAKRVGFDGVELHYAHAYTMASFLSRLNVRDDGYGGSPENRLRLPLDVFRAVRARVGDDYCVGIRLLGDEVIEGGSRIEDAVFYSTQFAQAGADYISVSKGGKFEDAKRPVVGKAAYPYTGPSGLECMPTVRSDERGPFGRNVPLAAAIRRDIRNHNLTTPVVTSGGIHSFQQVEDILARGDADIAAAARQSLADPDWTRKILLGRGAEVRRCIYTNYCEGLDQVHKQVTCQLWDRDFQPGDDIPRSTDNKRRLLAPEWE